MVVDKEDHRTLLTQLVEQATFPGKMAEIVVELRDALKNATVQHEKPKS